MKNYISAGLIIIQIALLTVIIPSSKMKVGDCFEIPAIEATMFKVVGVYKNSYFAGRRSGKSTGKKFYKKYPAMQVTTVSFDEIQKPTPPP